MIGLSRPETYLSSSLESMTYEHPSEDAARRMIEREFNDAEDYLVAGTPAPSIRGRRPPEYHTVRNGGGYSRERSHGEEPRNGGGYQPGFTRAYTSYDPPMDMSPRDEARWEERERFDSKYSSLGAQSGREDRQSNPSGRREDPYSLRGESKRYGEDYPSMGSYTGRDEVGRPSRDPYGSSYDNGYDRAPEPSWRSNGANPYRSSSGNDLGNGRTAVRELHRERDSKPSYTGTTRHTSDDRYSPERAYGRQKSRVLYDGAAEAREKERRFREESRAHPKPREEREFLGKVQRELEEKRAEWKDEIDRLSNSTLMPSTNTSTVAKNSTIDTSSGRPVFKAFVDVSEFTPSSVKVNVDKLTNKVVVEAKQHADNGSVTKSFTHRLQLPRFADDHNLVARMNRKGILKVEVPLIFYFPEHETRNDTSKANSFVYEVRTDPVSGSKVMEILVNTGKDMSSRDLKVEMEGDKLQIWADRASGSAGSISPSDGDARRSLIKQYTMPPNADYDHIRIERTRDGRHAVLIPLF